MLHSAIYRAFYMIMQFIIGIVLANVLLPPHWGDLSLFIVNAAIISLVTGFGADSMVIHSLTNDKWHLSEALFFLWRVTILQISLFLFAESVVFFSQGTTILSLSHEPGIIIELLYFTGLILTEKYTALFYSLNKAKLANALLLINVLVFLLVLAIMDGFVTISYRTALIFISLQVFLQGLSLCVLFHLRLHGLVLKRLAWKFFWYAFRLSLVVMVTNILQFIAYRVDFYLLEKYHSNYEVGIYAQANKFANLVWVIPGIFASLVMARFREFNKEELSVFFRVALTINFLTIIITALVTSIIYSYFLHSDYSPGLKSFYIMLPGYFFFSLVVYLAAYVSWLGKFHYNLIGSSFCLLVIFFSDLLFIPSWSFDGAALSNTIAYSLTFLLYIVTLFRKSPYRLNNFLLPKRTDFYFLLKLIK